MTTNLYGYPPASRYRLYRDGGFILEGTEQECWAYIHRNYSGSIERALRYEGYTMDPVPTKEA